MRLTPEEEAFVRRVAHWSEPPPSGARRAAFAAGIGERLARRRARGTRGLVAAAAAAAALLAWSWIGLPRPAGEPDRGVPAVARGSAAEGTAAAGAAETPEETILALTSAGDDAGEDAALPEDYAAIAGLFLGG